MSVTIKSNESFRTASFSLFSLFVSVIFMITALSPLASTTQIENQSFTKPFDLISADGVRQVGKEWQHGGSTQVNRYFIRLTPDRQSKRGYIWNSNPLDLDELSIVFTFRVSGQGERWFGDGIALWVTQQQYHLDGDFHGFTDKYVGFGLIFDTFRNAEHQAGHKDVSVVINDGTKSLDDLNYEERKGCDVNNLRYHEKNAAFNPSVNASRAKIQIKNNRIRVQMDPQNSGQWTDCFEGPLGLSNDWMRKAYIGSTASTGSLADNHDVVMLAVYNDVEDVGHYQEDAKVIDNVAKPVDVHNIAGTELDKIKELQRQFERLQVEFEHQLTALKESTQNTIQKLEKQEQLSDNRIAELERMVNNKVDESVGEKLNVFHKDVSEQLDQKISVSVSKSSGWKLPFFLLATAIGVGAFFLYKKYQELRKSHLL